MKFLYYDIIFLLIFGIFLIIFLYKRRKNLKREGLLYLYRTQIGIKFINYVGKKYKKTLKILSYLVVITGYILMAAMLYFLGYIVYIFYTKPEIVKAIKVPPLMPLIPYLPSIFKIEFLPPFYFTYWIIAIAIIAVSHEFSHGIFARFNNVGVKSTGFGFLGPFLAAFVEPDEKQMAKKGKFSQLSILSAGSFSNILMTIIFFIILISFFSLTYAPAGAIFNTYATAEVNTSEITSINGLKVNNIQNSQSDEILNLINNSEIENTLVIDFDDESFNLTEIKTKDKIYFTDIEILKSQLEKLGESNMIIVYSDAPAIRAELKGTIIEINDVKIKNQEDLSEEMAKYKPQESIILKTKYNDEILSYNLQLGESPENKGRGYLGIGVYETRTGGISGFINKIFNLFKKSSTLYEPKFDSNLIIFIYNLIWWIVLINFSVGLINMLPVGLFDGGRFFFLTIFAITKKEKIAKSLFKIMTYLILFIFLLLMIFWFWAFI